MFLLLLIPNNFFFLKMDLQTSKKLQHNDRRMSKRLQEQALFIRQLKIYSQTKSFSVILAWCWMTPPFLLISFQTCQNSNRLFWKLCPSIIDYRKKLVLLKHNYFQTKTNVLLRLLCWMYVFSVYLFQNSSKC